MVRAKVDCGVAGLKKVGVYAKNNALKKISAERVP
jgi:hypothetical protein